MNAHPFFLGHVWLIPLFPLLTAAAMLFIGRRLNNSAVNALCRRLRNNLEESPYGKDK